MSRSIVEPPDHPRSRGEHIISQAQGTPISGSSPLARGARSSRARISPLIGIIPARAGSTASTCPISAWTGDHPRSRGEHLAALAGEELGPGSSPLARGAPRDRGLPRVVGGIIPARAGSTRPELPRDDGRPDHPRSRGEHGAGTPRSPRRCGSSPLARGAPQLLIIGTTALRIIPARAGSTVGIVTAKSGGEDHPRSRGEHRHDALNQGQEPGSSPLARGAHRRRTPESASRGIIPARAGSTLISFACWHVVQDHPRSRGEHDRMSRSIVEPPGSSPLARGARGW